MSHGARLLTPLAFPQGAAFPYGLVVTTADDGTPGTRVGSRPIYLRLVRQNAFDHAAAGFGVELVQGRLGTSLAFQRLGDLRLAVV